MTLKLTFNPIIFPDHTQPRGALSSHMGAQACWYFFLLAQKQKEIVGTGVESQTGRLLEGELWMDTHYENLARTVAMMYGLESPDEFAKFWTQVKQEAYVCGLPIPADEYTKLAPKLIHQ